MNMVCGIIGGNSRFKEELGFYFEGFKYDTLFVVIFSLVSEGFVEFTLSFFNYVLNTYSQTV